MMYYVYAYLRSKDSPVAKKGTPYYIGKGKGSRCYCNNRIFGKPKSKKDIVLLFDNLSEPDAFEQEKRLIALYGRVDKGTGILRNLTDGGEGASGHIVNEEMREKMIKHNIEHWRNMSPSAYKRRCVNMAKGQMGKKHSSKTKRKMSRRMTGNQIVSGRKYTAKDYESRKNLYEKMKGNKWNVGRKHTPETIARCLASKLKKYGKVPGPAKGTIPHNKGKTRVTVNGITKYVTKEETYATK